MGSITTAPCTWHLLCAQPVLTSPSARPAHPHAAPGGRGTGLLAHLHSRKSFLNPSFAWTPKLGARDSQGTSQTHWARLPPPRELPENWQEGAYLQTVAQEAWRVGIDPVPAVGGSERLGNLLKITQLEKAGREQGGPQSKHSVGSQCLGCADRWGASRKLRCPVRF